MRAVYRARTSPTRLGAAALAIVLITTACGSSTPTTAPSGQPLSQASGQPTQPAATQPAATQPGATDALPATGEPLPTLEPPAPPEPLQEPELTAVDEIAEALLHPELAEQAVVSMLDELGIGIYKVDGSPIRVGSETSDADFYLFEPEVRGLIAMLQEQDQPDSWITFRDFHSALAGMGYQGTAEELATAYADAYSDAPDDPIVKFVSAVANVDPEASFPRAGAWLLLLDGFVPPNTGGAQATAQVATARAASAGWLAQASFGAPRYGTWGRARSRIGSQTPPSSVDSAATIARLMTIAAQFSITVAAASSPAHEGHGGNGTPIQFTAVVSAPTGGFISPFTGMTELPVNPNPAAGLPVTWHPDDAMNRHGSFAPLTDTTGVVGGVRATFTPKREKADGHGIVISELATVTASVPARAAINSIYGLPLSAGTLLPGEVTGVGRLGIQWHTEAMDVVLTNKYNVTIKTFAGDTHTDGTDTFTGSLGLTEDGRWIGTLDSTAVGSFSGSAFGQAGCTSSWNAQQKLMVVGTATPNSPSGNFIFSFYPALAPTGSMGRGRCPPTPHKLNGMYYAPFNDYVVTTPNEGNGLRVTLPAKPGGTSTYPVTSVPGSGIIITNTSWVVKITFPAPSP